VAGSRGHRGNSVSRERLPGQASQCCVPLADEASDRCPLARTCPRLQTASILFLVLVTDFAAATLREPGETGLSLRASAGVWHRARAKAARRLAPRDRRPQRILGPP
jgi:hypothetical protein